MERRVRPMPYPDGRRFGRRSVLLRRPLGLLLFFGPRSSAMKKFQFFSKAQDYLSFRETTRRAPRASLVARVSRFASVLVLILAGVQLGAPAAGVSPDLVGPASRSENAQFSHKLPAPEPGVLRQK